MDKPDVKNEDIAAFRPSNGVWYLLRSLAGFTAVQFGTNEDVPAPAAYTHLTQPTVSTASFQTHFPPAKKEIDPLFQAHKILKEEHSLFKISNLITVNLG